MLTTTTLTHAKPIADLFNWQAKSLVAAPGSPVDILAKSVYGLTESDSNIQQQSLKGMVGRAHGDIEAAFVKGNARIISNIVSKARNDINPMRTDIKERVDKALTRLTGSNAIATVTQVEIPTLFLNDAFVSQIAIYNKSVQVKHIAVLETIKDVDSFNAFQMTDGEYEDLLATGSSSIDAQAAKYVLNKGTYELRDLLHYADLALENKLNFTEYYKVVAAYLMVCGLINGNVERFDYINTNSTARMSLSTLKASLGSLLSRKIDMVSSSVRAGDLYVPRRVQVASTTNDIVVYGKTYRTWIEGDGTIEALLGAFILNGSGYRSAKFTTDPIKAISAYNRKITYMENLLLVKRKEVFYNTVTSTITSIINERDEDERAVLHELLKQATTDAKYRNLPECIYIRDVVCAVFTKGTEVQFVLSEIDTFLETNPESNLKSAVMFATIALVGRWIASQLAQV